MIHETEAEDAAEYAVGLDFQDLSCDEQAVLAYATLLALRDLNGWARVSLICQGLRLSEETIYAIVESLYEKGLAWLGGECPGEFDCVYTRAADALLILAPGAGGRPNQKDWAALREEVFARHFQIQDPHCLYCKAEGVDLVLDHVVPVSRGGSNHPLNLLPACVPCNSGKRNFSYREWRERQKARA